MRILGLYEFAAPWKSLSGESRSSGENRSEFVASYKYKNIRFGLGWKLLGYPKGYDYVNKTDSKYYKSESHTYIKNNGNMLYFSLSYDFNHGRRYRSGGRSLNNSDTETGLR